MSAVKTWSTTAANNSSTPPDGAPEGWAPSTVNDTIREIMAQVRTYANSAEWFEYGDGDGAATIAYASATSFTVATDVTAVWHAGRRVKAFGTLTGTIYGKIASASYSAPNTTVTVTWDSGSLSNEALTVWLGILSSSNTSLPVVAVAGGGTGASTAADARTNLGLGTAAIKNTGTSGNVVPLLDGANTFSADQVIQSADAGSAGGPNLYLDRASASPAASDTLGAVVFQGKDSAANTQSYARIFTVLIDPTSTSEDARIEFETVIAGTSATRLFLGAGLYSTTATGGDKGDNTINFSAVYDDNVLLTCGPVELLSKGTVDLDKWDSFAPGDRKHEVMHRFSKMRDEGFDPRDAGNFCARMKADGAVPGLMTEAEWRDRQSRNDKPDIGTMTTMTLLAVDNLAVAFSSLVDRMEALEKKVKE